MAIATDAIANFPAQSSITSATFAHTCSGSGRVLFVGIQSDLTSDLISGVTYNNIAMTRVGGFNITSGTTRWTYLYVLANPSTGANNIVVSASSSTVIEAYSASYTGANIATQPNTSTTNSVGPGSVFTLTSSVTTTIANCWTILMATERPNANAGILAAGAGTTARSATGGIGLYDSNAAITPAGSTSLVTTMNASGSMFGIAHVMAAIAPAVNFTLTENVTTSDTLSVFSIIFLVTETLAGIIDSIRTTYGWVAQTKSTISSWINQNKS